MNASLHSASGGSAAGGGRPRPQPLPTGDEGAGQASAKKGILSRLHSVLARVRGSDAVPGAKSTPRTAGIASADRTGAHHAAGGAASWEISSARRLGGIGDGASSGQLHHMLQNHNHESLEVADGRVLAHALGQLDKSRPLSQRLGVLEELTELVRTYKVRMSPHRLWSP